MDDRRVYGAYGPGILSVPIGVTESGSDRDLIEYFPQFTAAFVVSCVGVEEVYNYMYVDGPALVRAYVADFKVESDVYLHHGRFRTHTVTGFFRYANPDGSPPVEEGKRYVIAGYMYSQSGGQGTVNPTWYYFLPQNRLMPNALDIRTVGYETGYVETAVINGLYEVGDDIRPTLVIYGVTSDMMPMKVYDYIPQPDPETGYAGQMWFELEGSLDDALASEQGDNIRAALSVAEISVNSLMVITTNDINSIQRFNQRTNKIASGRGFSAKEIAGGARVCVISELLAELNGLSVGDTLALQLYPTTLGRASLGDQSAWPPNPYHPGTELTGPVEFKIVGLYSGLTKDMTDYAVSPNTVIIPAASFTGAGGDPAVSLSSNYPPPLLYTIVIPNDGIEEAKALIESTAEGFSGFFRFYDQGYATLKPILVNLRFSMTWIIAIAALGWVISISMFSVFYIGRKKRDISLLYGVGVSKGKGFLWAYLQSAAIIIIAQCIVLGVSASFFGNILSAAVTATRAFTEGYRDFTLSDMNVAGGVRLALPLETSLTGVILAAAGTAVLLLGAAAYFSIRTVKRSSLMTRNAE